MASSFLPNLLQGIASNPFTKVLPAGNVIQDAASIGSALLPTDQPASLPATTSAQSGTGGGSNYTYADFMPQNQNVYGTASDAANNSALGYKNNILGLIDSLQSGQNTINNASVNAEIAKQRGTSDVYGGIKRGIQSGGVTLANRNASDSSAADAIARAYGDIGRRQLSDVNNQYGLAENNIGQQQANLGVQASAGVRNLLANKDQTINDIVASARQQLGQLDASMLYANLPQRINIEQEKEAIRQSTQNTLSQYDQLLTSGVAGVTPQSQQDSLSKATQLNNQGTIPLTNFLTTSATPVQFQNTGPFASSLPLFMLPTNKKTQTA